jgi:hypothetical protein
MPRSCGLCGSGNLVSLNERETPTTCEGVLALQFLKQLEKILLIDGVQYFHRRFLHDLVLQSGNRDRSLLPILFRYVDPAERLGLVLSVFEPLIKLLDLSLGVAR